MGPLTAEERAALIAVSPFRGKYETAIDPESAYEILQKRVSGITAAQASAQGRPAEAGAPGGAGAAGVLGGLGAIVGTIFGTNVPRGRRLSTGQLVARSVTRTVTNQVAGKMAADIGRQMGGKLGGSVGRAIVRGALGGILRR
jgi:hypothetical protein